ncbi:MAG: hypothetical protein U9R34_05340 [Nanoarchaeota archaeon]|nr:hypothetical protein [Nanoarchaeota archaeon]
MARIKDNKLIVFVMIMILLTAALLGYSSYLNSSKITGLSTGTIQVTVKNDEPSLTPIPDQIWLMNNSLTIMLYDYFNDPEGIPLTFSNTAIDNITMNINQSTSKVTLLPDPGWVGEMHILFYASDGPNTRTSNSISLLVVSVMPEPKPAPEPGSLAEQPPYRHISGCFYKWECEAWAECLPEGIQERVCINKGTCPDAYRSPVESRKCFYKEIIVEQPLPLPEEEPKQEVINGQAQSSEDTRNQDSDFKILLNMFLLIAIIFILLLLARIRDIIKKSILKLWQSLWYWAAIKRILRFLADVPDEDAFIANDKQIAKNLKDMHRILLKMNNETFIYHVNEKKNDISYWIKNFVGDKKLASQLDKSKSKTAKSFALIIGKRISRIRKFYKTNQIKH